MVADGPPTVLEDSDALKVDGREVRGA